MSCYCRIEDSIIFPSVSGNNVCTGVCQHGLKKSMCVFVLTFPEVVYPILVVRICVGEIGLDFFHSKSETVACGKPGNLCCNK